MASTMTSIAEERSAGALDEAPSFLLSDQVVQVDEVARQGSSICSRYTCSRELEQDYAIEDKVLGSGMSGPVLLAKGRADGRKHAVKSFKKDGISVKHRDTLRNEAELYLTLDHPHIAQLQRVIETSDMLYLIMEFMEGGELYDRLAAAKKYSEEVAADTTYQMLLAVAYLHAHKIAHRDLKLENFLYARRDSNCLKLIDFGFAKFLNEGTVMKQACGSVHYVAPEVLKHSYTVQADMWSLGVIAYMLLTGTPVFMGTDKEILRQIKVGKPRFNSRFSNLSEIAQNFVKKLLVGDPDKRLTAAQALEHPWIAGRHAVESVQMDTGILGCLRGYAQASHFRRAVLCMMAWTLSVEEQEELRQQFLLIDASKNGTIKLQELKSVLEEFFQVDSAEAEHLFNSLDTDNSEEIEYTEFLAAALVGRLKAHEDVLRRAFQRFDIDHDGLISAEELREVLGDDFEETEVEDLLQEVDTSGDGRIDFDEFLAYFHQSDADDLDPASPIARRLKKRHTTEKLGAVMERLIRQVGDDAGTFISDQQITTDGQRPGQPALMHRVARRAQTMPLGLPTLLGSPVVRAGEKEVRA